MSLLESVPADSAPLSALSISDADDPRVIEEAARDDYSLHVVPRTWRLGSPTLGMAWSSLMTAMFWLVYGATVALAVGTRDALIGIGVSVFAYGAVNYVLSSAAARTGLTVATFSRSMFGFFGASVATAVFAAGAIYYAVFEGSVLAVAFQTQFGGSINIWYAVIAALAIPLVAGGVRVWLDRLNGALLPVFVLGMITAVIWTIATYGYHGTWASYHPRSTAGVAGPGWWFAFTSYMGVWLCMFYAFDFARLGRTEQRRRNSFWLFGPPYWFITLGLNAVVGIFLALTLPHKTGVSEAGLVVGLVQLMGYAGLIFVFATQMKINSANVYLASSNLQSFFSRVLRLTLPRWLWTVIVAITMFLIMKTDVFSFILKALQYQGALVVSWVGIALVQVGYLRLRLDGEAAAEFRPGRVPSANPGGLIAWVVSSGVGIFLIADGTPVGVTWALPVAFALAAGIYAGALLFARPGWFVTQRPFDPREEVDDVWRARIVCASCAKAYVAVEMDRQPQAPHAPICAQCATGYGFHRASQDAAVSRAG